LGGDSEEMKISIIICAHNEEQGIGKLLKNLAKQKKPPNTTDYELIIVASGCTDKTIPIIKKSMARNSKIKLIEEKERKGKAAAFNKALKTASGELIVSIPADVLPKKNGLYHLLSPFRDPKVSVVSGKPMEHPKSKKHSFLERLNNITQALWAKEMRILNHAGFAAHSSGEFMAMKADLIEYIPEESATEDSYIAILARRKGFIKFAQKAIAYNIMPSNILDYINQRRRWLYGHFQTHKLTGEYPTVMDTLIFLRPKLAVRIIMETVLENLRQLPYFFIATFIEIGIYALVIIDTMKQRQYAIWPIIKSTKGKIEN
jgi:cellulose synthase/poly-beta-1,6-N-acetylglucosamine synthase-like glycosyltransferase